MVIMTRLARRLAPAAVVALLMIGSACSGGNDGAEGSYEHPEEGTITLSADGKGMWEQEGNDEPFEFEWEEKGDVIILSSDGEEEGEVRIEDGDLVLPPDMISGDEDVTFKRR